MAEQASSGLPTTSPGTPLEDYRLAIFLGLADPNAFSRLLGLESPTPLELARQIQEGLPFRSFLLFQSSAGLPSATLAQCVGLPLRTLHRRKGEGRLTPDESDRLVRAARVFGRALEMFEGDVVAAREWLATPQRALGGGAPLDLARTDVGAREVEDLIGRIEHGIPS